MSFVSTAWGRFQGVQRRVIGVACGAHILHDGYTDLLYVLLPLWQTEFGLGYAEVGILRALYVGAMAGFQVPSGAVAGRIGGPLLLGLGTALAGLGYLTAGASHGFWMLIAALVIGGIGSSVQHPIAAHLVAQAFPGARSRSALAEQQFLRRPRQDGVPGRDRVAADIAALARRDDRNRRCRPRRRGRDPRRARPPGRGAAPVEDDKAGRPAGSGRGFPLLLSIAMIDSATRMGFLTFLPFLLKMKGADLPMIGFALTLIFAGGATGKLVCGWLGNRIGMVRATWLTEGATALGILALIPLPLYAGLAVLPLIGIALNGTSSVLYGTVPELVAPEKRQRAFSIFYTGAVGAGCAGAGAVRRRQRPRQRPGDDGAGRRDRAGHLAARLAPRPPFARRPAPAYHLSTAPVRAIYSAGTNHERTSGDGDCQPAALCTATPNGNSPLGCGSPYRPTGSAASWRRCMPGSTIPAVAPAGPRPSSGVAGIVNDAIAFYFEDAAFAHAFVNRFCCGYRPVEVDRSVTGAFSLRPVSSAGKMP